MNVPRKVSPTSPDEGHLTVNLAGPPELVARLLRGMAGALDESQDAGADPAPLFLTRQEAAARSGFSEERISGLIKAGKLTNHGSAAKIRISLAELRSLQARIE